MTQRLLLVLLFSLFPSLARPATYYVDSAGGNDANNGSSPTSAWKTLAKINGSQFAPGDTILLRRGSLWREQLIFPSSGSPEARITIDAYGSGELPVISGTEVVPAASWSQCASCSPHVWQAAVDPQPNAVIFDGTKGNKQPSLDQVTKPGDWFWQSRSLYAYSEANPQSASSRSSIEIGARPTGINLTGRSYITLKHVLVTGANTLRYGEGGGIWAITNHLEGPTPNDLLISEVTVTNCAGDAIHIENSDHSTVESSLVTNNEGAGIELYHSNGKFPIKSGTITNNDVHHNGFNGIFVVGCPRAELCRSVVYPDGLTVSGIKIVGNKVHDNGAGIYITETNDSLVSNNTAYSNTNATHKGEGYCVGLSGSSSNIVERNDCYKARLSGIELSIDTGKPPFGSSNNVIRHNVIHDDGSHGVFTNYVPSQHNKIQYNLIYNHPNGSCIMANYMGHEISNNTCYNSKLGIHFYVSASTQQTGNISVKNNLIINSSQYHVLIEPGVQGPFDFANNDYFPDSPERFSWKGAVTGLAGWRANSGQDANSMTMDPQFASATPSSPREFSLRAGSPAIGGGADLGTENQVALSPDSVWPDHVSLTPQPKSHWDLGAFRHQR